MTLFGMLVISEKEAATINIVLVINKQWVFIIFDMVENYLKMVALPSQ